MNKLVWSRWVMIVAIILLFVMQGLWLNKFFQEERRRIIQQTDLIFKDLVYKMQLQRFKADTVVYNAIRGNNIFGLEKANAVIAENKKILDKPKKVDSLSRAIFLERLADSMFRGLKLSPVKKPNNSSIQVFLDSTKENGIKISSIKITAIKKDSSISQPDSLASILSPQIELKASNNFNLPETKNSAYTDRKSFANEAIIRPKSPRSLNSFSFIKTAPDSLSFKELDSAYASILKKEKIDLQYKIIARKENAKTPILDTNYFVIKTNIANVGLVNPTVYQAFFEDPYSLVLRRILPQAFFSIFLVILVSLAFLFMFHNIKSAQKLSFLKNDFISNMTHELKTPVATVQVAVEALRKFDAIHDPQKTKDYLEIASLELQRLGFLVDKVLRITMFDQKGFKLSKAKLNFKDLVQSTLATMHIQFEKQGASVSFIVGQDEYFVKGDELHLRSVIYNLIDNAQKYSIQPAEILIRLTNSEKQFIRLDVEDKGIGISPQYLPKIFDRFFRVPQGDLHTVKGYGLGLSYVNQIVQDHGGYIKVKSIPGKGSNFSIWLPQIK